MAFKFYDVRPSLWFSALLLLLLLPLNSAFLPVEVSQGRYNNLVIAIHDSVPENLTLIDEIKKELQDASSTMILATRRSGQFGGLAFGNVTILVPSTWPDRPQYSKSTWQLYSKSQIRVGLPNPRYGPVPYTEGPGRCGVPGEFTYYPTEFFLDRAKAERMFGARSRLMFHEWAHLRWGLLEELPQENDPHFYIYNNKFYPSRCSEQLDGKMANRLTGEPCVFNRQTLMPEPDCIFIPNQSNRALASFMGHYYISSIKGFCDQSDSPEVAYRHNRLAPSQQNRLCRSRSVWQVIGQHEDFQKDRPSEVNYIPDFEVVRARSRVVLAVLDISESMEFPSKVPFLKLKAAMIYYIRTVLESDARLGIVTFGTGVKVLSPLKTIGPINGDVRNKLEEQINYLDSIGQTDLGDGLMTGLNELLKESPVGGGGSIFLVSDGEENPSPLSKFNYNTSAAAIRAAGVTVDVLGLGPEADTRIGDLARDTGGKYYTSFNNRTSFDLLSALMTSAASTSSGAETPLLLHSIDIVLPAKPFASSGTFNWAANVAIDSSARGRLQFVFLFPVTVSMSWSDFLLTSPISRTQYRSRDKEGRRDDSLNMMSLDLSETSFESGIWIVDLVAWDNSPNATDKANKTVSMVISSKPASSGAGATLPISTSATISTFKLANNSASVEADVNGVVVTAAVRSGSAGAVLRARVFASVRAPDNDLLNIDLQDNGVGMDLRPNDGVYTGVLSPRRLTGVGDYLVTVNAESVDGVTGVVVGPPPGASPFVGGPNAIDTRANYTLAPVTNLTRSSLAGSFKLETFSEAERRIDRVPPSPIASLNLLSVNDKERSANFSWIAVGDDYDQGRAFKYEAYWSTNGTELLDPDQPGSGARKVLPSNLIHGNLSMPAESGSREHLGLRFHDVASATASVVYLAIRAIDAAGNRGGLAFPTAMTFEVLPFADTSRPTEPSGGNPYLGVIIGVVVSVVVIAIVIAAVYIGLRMTGQGVGGGGPLKFKSAAGQ